MGQDNRGFVFARLLVFRLSVRLFCVGQYKGKKQQSVRADTVGFCSGRSVDCMYGRRFRGVIRKYGVGVRLGNEQNRRIFRIQFVQRTLGLAYVVDMAYVGIFENNSIYFLCVQKLGKTVRIQSEQAKRRGVDFYCAYVNAAYADIVRNRIVNRGSVGVYTVRFRSIRFADIAAIPY